MRKSIALGLTALTTAGLAAFVPTSAFAACNLTTGAGCLTSGDTTVTATVGISASVLAIAVDPASVLTQSGSTLSNAVPISATVTDTNIPAGANGSWKVDVSASALTLSGASTTIPASGNASIFTDTPLPAVTGTVSVTDSHNSGSSPLALSGTPATLMTASTNNANVVTYHSTLTWNVPNGTPMGLYTGTVTQTVS